MGPVQGRSAAALHALLCMQAIKCTFGRAVQEPILQCCMGQQHSGYTSACMLAAATRLMLFTACSKVSGDSLWHYCLPGYAASFDLI